MDHRPVYSIFTAKVQIPSQQAATQSGDITCYASLLGPGLSTQLHGHKLLLIARVSMEDGAS
jgi:hypothetical protein